MLLQLSLFDVIDNMLKQLCFLQSKFKLLIVILVILKQDMFQKSDFDMYF